MVTATYMIGDRRGRDRMVVGFAQLPVQSLTITTKVASSNLAHRRRVLDTKLCDKVCQCLADRLVVFSGYSGFFHQ